MRTAIHRGKKRSPIVESLEPRALLAVAGSLDPAFGNGYGFTTTSIGLPVGSETVDGTLPVSVGYFASVDSAAALPGGGVVVAESGSYDNGFGESSELVVAELNADGSVNTSFGTNGEVQIPIGEATRSGPTGAIHDAQVFQLGVDPTGRILLAAATTDASGDGTYLVARLTATGAFDSTFGTGGVAEYPAGTTTSAADRISNIVAVLPQSNDQVVLAGSSSGGFSAVRLNSDGSLDTTYGTDGTATVSGASNGSNPAFATGAVMQANGQVVLVGNLITENSSPLEPTGALNTDIGAIRLNTDGSQDTTFGGTTAAGLVVIPPVLGTPTDLGFNPVSSVALDPTTGQILLRSFDSGYSLPTTNNLYRLNTDGTLDTSFGTGGLVNPGLPNVPTANDASGSLTVQANGDILLTTAVDYASSLGIFPNKLELIRLNPDGSTDTTFGAAATPGVLLTRLIPTSPVTPVIDPTTGDILEAGIGTVPSPAGLTYGFSVASILATANDAPAATPAPPTPPADFDGLGYSDAAVYQPTSISPGAPSTINPEIGAFISQSGISPGAAGLYDAFGSGGVGGSIPAAADYLGLGFDQVAVYLPSIGVYAVQATASSPLVAFQFGVAGAGQTIPVPADYYGTGQADIAVYIPAQGVWAIKDPSGQTPGFTVSLGIPGVGQSIPAPADYFGTGEDDLAVYLTQSATFAILNPATQQVVLAPYGKPGIGQSIAVPGNYDGSGVADLAVYIPSIGAYIYNASGGQQVVVPVGTANSGEIPVPGDYDGSGRTEAAVYDAAGAYIEYEPARGGPEVKIAVGYPDTNSLPVTAIVGALPGFGDYLSSSGTVSSIRAEAVLPPSTSTVAPTSVAVSSTKAAAVPSGPTPASIRVARSLINQAAPDPLELD